MAKVRTILLILLVMVMAVVSMTATAESELSEVWVLCQPDSFVNVRMHPRKDSESIGRLELGDMGYTDGKSKNGFLHIMYPGLECDGWISKGFISRTTVFVEKIHAKIASRGKVRCRRSVNGTRRKWLKNGSEIIVFGYGDDWAVTDYGFIQVKFLTWEGKEE